MKTVPPGGASIGSRRAPPRGAAALAVTALQRRAGVQSSSWNAAVDKALAWLEDRGQKVVFHPCQRLGMKLG